MAGLGSHVRIIADRKRPLPAPPPIVWADLTTPDSDGPRAWLRLLPDEVAPEITAGLEPRLVTWSSLWTRHPDLVIRLDCQPDGAGTRLHVVIEAPDDAPDGAWIGHVRHRINKLLFRDLRYSYGQ